MLTQFQFQKVYYMYMYLLWMIVNTNVMRRFLLVVLSLIECKRPTEGGCNPLSPPPPWKFWVFAVLNFDCTTCIYLNLSQHTIMYSVYNIYFTLYSYYKTIGYVWRGTKKIPRPQEFYRAPVLKYLDPSLK